MSSSCSSFPYSRSYMASIVRHSGRETYSHHFLYLLWKDNQLLVGCPIPLKALTPPVITRRLSSGCTTEPCPDARENKENKGSTPRLLVVWSLTSLSPILSRLLSVFPSLLLDQLSGTGQREKERRLVFSGLILQ